MPPPWSMEPTESRMSQNAPPPAFLIVTAAPKPATSTRSHDDRNALAGLVPISAWNLESSQGSGSG
jgi:hypothetical protein